MKDVKGKVLGAGCGVRRVCDLMIPAGGSQRGRNPTEAFR